MESLGDIGYVIQTGMLAVQAGVERARADREHARGNDWRVAAAVHQGAARGHARAASDWYAKLIVANAEIDRQREIIDERDLEISTLIDAAGDLLAENEALRAQIHMLRAA